MRKITEQATLAFLNHRYYGKDNTQVEQTTNNETVLKLHGHIIAKHKKDDGGKVYLNNCGWATNTTKERLNGILTMLNLETIRQRNFTWYRGKIEFKADQWNRVI